MILIYLRLSCHLVSSYSLSLPIPLPLPPLGDVILFLCLFVFLFFVTKRDRLGSQDAHTTNLLDLLLSTGTEELRLHNDGHFGQMASSKDLVVSLWLHEISKRITRIRGRRIEVGVA